MTNPKTPEALADEAKRLAQSLADAEYSTATVRKLIRRELHETIDSIAALAKQKAEAVPEGWEIEPRDGAFVVWQVGVRGYAARNDDDEGTASRVLYELASALLSARPVAQTAAQDLGVPASPSRASFQPPSVASTAPANANGGDE
jgi:hypothetical protein